MAYMGIYGSAKRSIHIVDDYISIKTLHLLQNVGESVKVTVVSDNVGHKLRGSDVEDFRRECPKVDVEFVKSNGAAHDRFIVIDRGAESERVFHCGASSKDAGYKMAGITEFTEDDVRKVFNARLSRMLDNPPLVLP